MNDERLTIRTALGLMKPLESFLMDGEVRSILVACTDVQSYLVSAWCEDSAVSARLEDTLKECGFTTYANNEGRRLSVAVTADDIPKAEVAVFSMSKVLDIPVAPKPVQRMAARSRVEPG